MPLLAALRHPVLTLRRPASGLEPRRADSRVSAFVYGDVLVLAATAGVSGAEIRSGRALLVLLGTVGSTYLAHVLADVVGEVVAEEPFRTTLLHELRDSLPIVSAGLPSGVLFGAAAAGWLGPTLAQGLACAVLLARIASLGLVFRRLRPGQGRRRAGLFGIGVAAAAALAVAIKLAAAH